LSHIGEYDTYNKVMEVDIKMNKLIFVLLLLLFSQSTFANWVSLTCVESGGNFTMTNVLLRPLLLRMK